MQHVCSETITFPADLWEQDDSGTDCLYTNRHTHLSLVTVTRLIQLSYVAVTVAYLFHTCDTAAGGRERGREGLRDGGKRREGNHLLLGGRGGTDPTYVFFPPLRRLLYFSVLLSSLVMPVRL